MQTASVDEIRAETGAVLMRSTGPDTSKQVSPVLLSRRLLHIYARTLMFFAQQTGILLDDACVRRKGSTRFPPKRGSAWSLNPNGRSVLLGYIPPERTTGDERAEHDVHLLNPPGGTLNRPRRLEWGGAGGGDSGGHDV